jgi:hypothetical protein
MKKNKIILIMRKIKNDNNKKSKKIQKIKKANSIK